MNSLSKALRDGYYPRTMRVSQYDSLRILDDFHCWDFAATSFYAHYMTKSGVQKKCLIIVFQKDIKC
tara:strand:- start:996 stop:1196 length:201 start_codon:yes stop_codon:yes gene_type:complete